LFISILCILLNIVVYHDNNHHPHPTTNNNGWFSFTKEIIQRRLYEVSINSTAIKGFKGHTKKFHIKKKKSLLHIILILSYSYLLGKSIFILDQGVKHHIPDWITFLSLGFTIDKVKMVKSINK
jgi:hypothetical protein